MSIHYKRLTENELDTFIDLRIQQLREEGATEDIDLNRHFSIIIIGIWQMVRLCRGLLWTEI